MTLTGNGRRKKEFFKTVYDFCYSSYWWRECYLENYNFWMQHNNNSCLHVAKWAEGCIFSLALGFGLSTFSNVSRKISATLYFYNFLMWKNICWKRYLNKNGKYYERFGAIFIHPPQLDSCSFKCDNYFTYIVLVRSLVVKIYWSRWLKPLRLSQLSFYDYGLYTAGSLLSHYAAVSLPPTACTSHYIA